MLRSSVVTDYLRAGLFRFPHFPVQHGTVEVKGQGRVWTRCRPFNHSIFSIFENHSSSVSVSDMWQRWDVKLERR
ncbi:hypothetical protein ACH3XW_42920 [Acanthocheilonema viteae]